MTAKYPVDAGDDEGILDAVNYLLSGPAGLGQNFAGFSSFTPAYLTANFRIPFSQSSIAQLYVPAITIDTVEMLDDRTVKIDYTTAGLTTPPFALGNGLSVDSIADPAYNDMLNFDGVQIGVVECTTTYVIIRLQAAYPLLAPSSGGTVEYFTTGNFFNSTDCDSRVTVTGASDRVFLSGQLDNLISYEVFSAPAILTYTVAIRRYTGFINEDPTNPDFLFATPVVVVEKAYEFSGLSGTGTLPLQETVFATFIDEPDPGFYRYILEVKFRNNLGGDMQVTSDELKLRSISAQVVKQ
jgi:hypothetical protein